MLLSGSRGAPYTCLRCQLRQAIFHSQRRCIERTSIEARRPFSAAPQHREQEDDIAIKTHRLRDGRPYYYRRPLGRIVGAPGRKQRQGTQTLKIDAMKKPFEVIVMQDVREPEEKRQPMKLQNGNVVSSAEIEKELEQEGQNPTQEEVNESIGALRPETTLLDEDQYRKLAKRLTSGFTTEQLYNFFTHTFNLSAVEGDTVHLLREQPSELQTRYETTQWRPGRTTLEKRLPLGNVVKKSEKANKPKIVEHILRLTWNLSMHAEEQQGGELEMKLKSWEMKFLFDVRSGGSPQYRWLVDSDLLLRACEMRPHRRSGHLRVYGRRQDAEEVLSRIATKLSGFGLLTVPLDTFRPLLGTPGWPVSFDELFSEEDVQNVQTRTGSIVEQPQPGVLCIFGKTATQRSWTRRLLLSLLELPAPGVTLCARDPTTTRKKAVLLPEATGSTMHLRHRNLGLTRLTRPVERSSESRDASSQKSGADGSTNGFVSSINAKVRKTLAGVRPLTGLPPDQSVSPRWGLVQSQAVPWKAQVCRVLHATDDKATRRKREQGETAAKQNRLTLINAQIPNLEALLSFFTPLENNAQADNTLLIARLVPSPFSKHSVKANKRLPPIELTYSSFVAADGSPCIRFRHARAILEQQDIHVPLPSEATDLRLSRWADLFTRGNKLQKDADIDAFTETLRMSLQSPKNARLAGRPLVRVRLPVAVTQGLDAGSEPSEGDVEVSYMFMGFEQQQTMDYTPVPVEKLPAKMDPGLKDALALFGQRFCLETREVRAGAIGGRRFEVWLRDVSKAKEAVAVGEGGGQFSPDVAANPASAEDGMEGSSEPDATSNAEEQEAITRQEVKIALGLTRLLTKINEGEVNMMLHHRPKIDDEGIEGEQSAM